MKKIVLIGDSIRMGYDEYVKAALEGIAEVYYPEENCMFSQYTLRCLPSWKKEGGWPTDVDLVHWNAGLWDVAEVYGEPPLSSKEHYADMIHRIDKRIRMLFPQAKVVFATSTCVHEEGYSGAYRRYNATIEAYNCVALEVLSQTDTIFNDLYTHSSKIPFSYRSDKTHFNTPEGAAYMGSKVVSVICDLLQITAKSIGK